MTVLGEHASLYTDLLLQQEEEEEEEQKGRQQQQRLLLWRRCRLKRRCLLLRDSDGPLPPYLQDPHKHSEKIRVVCLADKVKYFTVGEDRSGGDTHSRSFCQ